MKTCTNASLRLLSVLALLSVAPQASAYYDPGVQRWINRDPLTDIAIPTSDSRSLFFVFGARAETWGGANIYEFVRNNSLIAVDADGRFGVVIPILFPIVFPIAYPLLPGAICGNRIKDEVWEEYGKSRPPNDPSARLAHCIAHCRITRECPGGGVTSWIGGLAKEVLDEIRKRTGGGGDGFDWGDIEANATGRQFARCKNKSCEEQCQEALGNGSLYPDHAIR
jgi:hypothetical protein